MKIAKFEGVLKDNLLIRYLFIWPIEMNLSKNIKIN